MVVAIATGTAKKNFRARNAFNANETKNDAMTRVQHGRRIGACQRRHLPQDDPARSSRYPAMIHPNP